jgi:uncharacterized protein DUF3309
LTPLSNGIDSRVWRGRALSNQTILLIVLVLVLIGVLPTYPYSRAWGPYPAGIAAVLLIVVLLLIAMGRL